MRPVPAGEGAVVGALDDLHIDPVGHVQTVLGKHRLEIRREAGPECFVVPGRGEQLGESLSSSDHRDMSVETEGTLCRNAGSLSQRVHLTPTERASNRSRSLMQDSSR